MGGKPWYLLPTIVISQFCCTSLWFATNGVIDPLAAHFGLTPDALGQDFGATLTEAEVRWLMAHEFAGSAADVVWRRSKLGLRMTANQIETLDRFMSHEVGANAVRVDSPAAE